MGFGFALLSFKSPEYESEYTVRSPTVCVCVCAIKCISQAKLAILAADQLGQ